MQNFDEPAARHDGEDTPDFEDQTGSTPVDWQEDLDQMITSEVVGRAAGRLVPMVPMWRAQFREFMKTNPDESRLLDAFKRLRGVIFYQLAIECLQLEFGLQPYDSANQTGLMTRTELADFYAQLTGRPVVAPTSPFEDPGVMNVALPSAILFEAGEAREVYVITTGRAKRAYQSPHTAFARDRLNYPQVFGAADIAFVTPWDVEINSNMQRAMEPEGEYAVRHIKLEDVDQEMIANTVKLVTANVERQY